MKIKQKRHVSGVNSLNKVQNYNLNTDFDRENLSLLELPIFNQNKRLSGETKLIYNINNSQNIEIIPNGFALKKVEEKVFLSLLKIYKKQKNNPIVTSHYDILKEGNIQHNGYNIKRVKQALKALNGSYIKNKGLLATKEFTLLDNIHKIQNSKDEISDLFHLFIKQQVKELFNTRKLNEALIIKINENILSNLKKTFFKYVNVNKMLEINNATARKLFLLISKYRYLDMGNLIIKDCDLLSSHIPLSWDNKNISSSIQSLTQALDLLVKMELLPKFNLIKKSPLEKSKIMLFLNKKTRSDKMNVLAFVNQKGGCGKTSSSLNVARALTKQGYEVLIVDFDPQGNATLGLGIEPNDVEYTVYDMMKSKYLKGDEIVPSQVLKSSFGIDVLPNDISMAKIDIELGGVPQRNHMLKNVLRHPELKEKYDFVIIDCQPSLSVTTFNALTAANSVYVPIQSGYFSISGLTELLDTVDMISQDLNPNLKVAGIFMSIIEPRTVLYKKFKDELEELLPDKLMKTHIRKNEDVRRASANGKPVLDYDPSSNGAKDYTSLAQEILEKEKTEVK